MAASINASTSAGVVTTADTTGNLNLQSNGATVLAMTSAGIAVTGTQSATSNANFATTNTSGKVGIGTASPAVALDVSFDGSIQSPVAQFTRGTKKNQIGTDGNGGFIGTTSNDPLLFYTNNIASIGIYPSGIAPNSVVIGTNSSSFTMAPLVVHGPANSSSYGQLTVYSAGSSDVNNCGISIVKIDNVSTSSQNFMHFFINDAGTGSGAIVANGASAAAFSAYSDSSLKENIVDLPSQLDNIMALRPVEFDYIESEGGGHQIGFIAQEVQAIYPDLVGAREDGMLTLSDMNKNDARLIKAIQETGAIIKDLTARIAALEAK